MHLDLACVVSLVNSCRLNNVAILHDAPLRIRLCDFDIITDQLLPCERLTKRYNMQWLGNDYANPHCPIRHSSNSLKFAFCGGCFRQPDPQCAWISQVRHKGAVCPLWALWKAEEKPTSLETHTLITTTMSAAFLSRTATTGI